MDDKDIAIILALIEHPSSTNRELMEFIREHSNIDISIATISRRIKKLEEEGIINGYGANMNIPRLGLKLHSFIITPATPWLQNKLRLQALFREHYYTLYQNLVFGKNNGIFLQFTLPNTTAAQTYIIELFDWLVNDGVLETYSHYPHDISSISYATDLSIYNHQTRSWMIDYSGIDDIVYDDKTYDIEFSPLDQKIQSFDMLDVILLRELVIQSSKSQLDILQLLNKALNPEKAKEEDERYNSLMQLQKTRGSLEDDDKNFLKNFPNENHWQDYSIYRDKLKELPISKQTISRRINAIENKGLIDSYSLHYDREIFGVFNQLIFVVESSKDSLGKLDHILSTFLRFKGSLILGTDYSILRINLPSVEVMKLSDIILSLFDKAELYLLSRKPQLYPPWYKNYQQDIDAWDDSRERIFSSAISAFEKIKQTSIEQLNQYQ